MVIAFRADEVPAEHVLRRLPATLHLGLAALSREETRRLVESMAGPLPDAAADAVVASVGG